MRSFFKEVFEYHWHFNQKLMQEFNKHRDKLPERTYPLFCHIINAHQVWNARITGTRPIGVHQVHLMEKCLKMDEENYRNTIDILDSRNFDQTILYKNSKGEEFSNSIRDILFHVINHSTHHKGQIISDFRQQNIPPLVTDFIFYKRK